MMSTAVMVGEIRATDCAKSEGRPRTLVRSPCIFAMAEASFVPALLVIVSPSLGPRGKGSWSESMGPRSVGEGLVLEQEVLVEGAELPLGVRDGDLEHPQVRVGPERHLGDRPVVVRRVGEVGEH